MDYRKWGDPEIDEWREDPSSRKKLYASDLWEFGYWCYPSDSCSPWCCWPRRNCCPNRGCWPNDSCRPRRGCWPNDSCRPRRGCWPRESCYPR